MHSKTAILASILLAASISVHAQTVPLAKQRLVTINGQQYQLTSKLKKILIGSFYYNYNHNIATPLLDSTLTRIGRSETPPWTVDIETNGNNITAAKLGNPATTGYQVFFGNYISSWASATGFPTANRTAVQNFVEQLGGGVFIMHSSGDSRTGQSGVWPWYYNTAHPVNYTGESSRTAVSAHVGIPSAIKTHPVMEGITFAGIGTIGPDSVIFPQGEWHWFSKQITSVYPTADVFFRMNPATCTNNGTGTNCGVATSSFNYGTATPGYAASWTFPDMKGTISYFMEGHDNVTMTAMTQAVWDKFFKQFMYWTAGYDTVSVTGIHKGDLNFALDASGITFHPEQAGVYINKPGFHSVALYDMSGRLLKQEHGRVVPVDYDFSGDLRSAKSGVYLMRVAVAGGGVKVRRYFVR
ncbi:MAG TPA: hypothetical protein DCQ83_08845 [Fibrobacteres bacterium]|jgi:hypothetical protein|nr:hypothetical protein [Fibrobacterota bacterium]